MKKWSLRVAAGLVALVVTYGLVGFLIVPWIVGSQLPGLLRSNFGAQLTSGDVSFHPFRLALTLRDFRLADRDGADVLAGEEIYANLRLLPLIRGTVALDSLDLTAPQLDLVLERDGSLNLINLFSAPPATEPTPEPSPPAEGGEEGLFPVLMTTARIERGTLKLSDRSQEPPVVIEIDPLTLELRDFSTVRDASTGIELSATLAGGEVVGNGDMTIDPFRSSGQLKVNALPASALIPYLRGVLPLELAGGSLSLDAKFFHETGGSTKIGPADLTVSNLELKERDGAPVVSLPSLRASGAVIDLAARSLEIASLSSSKAQLRLGIAADGSLTPASLFAPGASSEERAADPPAAGDSDWSVTLGKVAIADYTLQLEDRSFEPPQQLDLTPIGIDIEGLRLTGDTPAKVDVAIGLPEGGKLTAGGTAAISPLGADLEIAIEGVDLRRLQPYAARAAKIELESGSAATSGKLELRSPEGAVELRYTGKAEVTELAVLDTARSEDLLKWSSLALNDLSWTNTPAKLAVGEIVAQAPYLRLVVDKQGGLNLAQVASVEDSEVADGSAAPVAAEAVPATTGEEPGMAVTIDRFVIAEGHMDFADFSFKPSVATGIEQLTGSVQGLSSDPSAKAEVDIDGKVDSYAPVSITGIINPFNPFTQTDVKMSFRGVNLSVFTPYSARFLGYEIEKGKASVEIEYRAADGKLRSDNEVVLERLTLGERVESPDATNLPITLAIALLKDRKGRIKLDLPVRGDLDDPKFDYGKVLRRTLFKVIERAVTSPFSILGALADFDEEELSYVEFTPGSSELEAEEAKKLDAIAKALQERPALSLEVRGRTDPAVDRRPLAEKKLLSDLRKLRRSELREAKEEVPQKLSQIELIGEDYDRLFAERFEKQFGEEPLRDDDDNVVPAAQARLLAAIEVSEGDFRKLGQKRAEAVQRRLLDQGVEQARIFVLEVDATPSSGGMKVQTRLSVAAK